MRINGGPRCDITEARLPGMTGVQLVRLRDEDRGIEVSVIPQAGGEIAGLRVKIGKRWRQILHRGLDFESTPPDGWRGRAPLLWPAVGRSFTAEQLEKWRATGRKPQGCRYTLDGRTRPMAIHGFARDTAWDLSGIGCNRTSARVKCGLVSSGRTRRSYPFAFEVSVTHRVENGEILSRYEVTAGGNTRPMPFCIGNHISFRLPFTGKGRFGDCAIRTPASRELLLDELSLLSGRSRPVALSRPVPLAGGEFLNAVLGGYRRNAAWTELIDPNSLTIRISQKEQPAGSKHLAAERDIFFVFWGTPEYGYFCPEPWIGRPNALNTGRGLIKLPPGERFVWEMRIAPVR